MLLRSIPPSHGSLPRCPFPCAPDGNAMHGHWILMGLGSCSGREEIAETPLHHGLRTIGDNPRAITSTKVHTSKNQLIWGIKPFFLKKRVLKTLSYLQALILFGINSTTQFLRTSRLQVHSCLFLRVNYRHVQ